jgi:hypothetical protein
MQHASKVQNIQKYKYIPAPFLLKRQGYYLLFLADQSRRQCRKFVSHVGYLQHAILMLSIYLLLNFRNLRHAISKLSSQVKTSPFPRCWCRYIGKYYGAAFLNVLMQKHNMFFFQMRGCIHVFGNKMHPASQTAALDVYFCTWTVG